MQDVHPQRVSPLACRNEDKYKQSRPTICTNARNNARFPENTGEDPRVRPGEGCGKRGGGGVAGGYRAYIQLYPALTIRSNKQSTTTLNNFEPHGTQPKGPKNTSCALYIESTCRSTHGLLFAPPGYVLQPLFFVFQVDLVQTREKKPVCTVERARASTDFPPRDAAIGIVSKTATEQIEFGQ